jgi:hypothetical protein
MITIPKKLKLKSAILLFGSISILGLLLTVELSPTSLITTVAVNTGEATLEKAVEKAARLDGAPSTPKVFNEVKRKNITDDWAFGSISISDPSEEGRPWTKLWLAQKTKNGWVAATDFTPTFIAWVKQAPQDIINQEERKILGSSSSQFGGILPALAGDTSGNFSFPWKPGTSWNLNSGPHGQAAGTTPWNSLDLAGGDQKVLAATGGLFYKSCSGSKVEIRQSNGWTTTYYHLANTAQIKDGTSIQRGTYLGNTGTTIGCGGSADGPHVHFSISLNGKKQSWNGREISGWTIYDGKKEYQGRAEKDGKVVYANATNGKALLYNPKYAIVNNVSNRCLDAFGAKVTSDGTPIDLWDCHHGVAEQWKFVNGQIRNIEGKCLDVVNDGKNYGNGSKIVLWNCHQGDNQKWSFNSSDGTIRGIGGKCLDAVNDGKNYGNGTQVVLWQCHGGVNQKWRKVD